MPMKKGSTRPTKSPICTVCQGALGADKSQFHPCDGCKHGSHSDCLVEAGASRPGRSSDVPWFCPQCSSKPTPRAAILRALVEGGRPLLGSELRSAMEMLGVKLGSSSCKKVMQLQRRSASRCFDLAWIRGGETGLWYACLTHGEEGPKERLEVAARRKLDAYEAKQLRAQQQKPGKQQQQAEQGKPGRQQQQKPGKQQQQQQQQPAGLQARAAGKQQAGPEGREQRQARRPAREEAGMQESQRGRQRKQQQEAARQPEQGSGGSGMRGRKRERSATELDGRAASPPRPATRARSGTGEALAARGSSTSWAGQRPGLRSGGPTRPRDLPSRKREQPDSALGSVGLHPSRRSRRLSQQGGEVGEEQQRQRVGEGAQRGEGGGRRRSRSSRGRGSSLHSPSTAGTAAGEERPSPFEEEPFEADGAGEAQGACAGGAPQAVPVAATAVGLAAGDPFGEEEEEEEAWGLVAAAAAAASGDGTGGRSTAEQSGGTATACGAAGRAGRQAAVQAAGGEEDLQPDAQGPSPILHNQQQHQQQHQQQQQQQQQQEVAQKLGSASLELPFVGSSTAPGPAIAAGSGQQPGHPCSQDDAQLQAPLGQLRRGGSGGTSGGSGLGGSDGSRLSLPLAFVSLRQQALLQEWQALRRQQQEQRHSGGQQRSGEPAGEATAHGAGQGSGAAPPGVEGKEEGQSLDRLTSTARQHAAQQSCSQQQQHPHGIGRTEEAKPFPTQLPTQAQQPQQPQHATASASPAKDDQDSDSAAAALALGALAQAAGGSGSAATPGAPAAEPAGFVGAPGDAAATSRPAVLKQEPFLAHPEAGPAAGEEAAVAAAGTATAPAACSGPNPAVRPLRTPPCAEAPAGVLPPQLAGGAPQQQQQQKQQQSSPAASAAPAATEGPPSSGTPAPGDLVALFEAASGVVMEQEAALGAEAACQYLLDFQHKLPWELQQCHCRSLQAYAREGRGGMVVEFVRRALQCTSPGFLAAVGPS